MKKLKLEELEVASLITSVDHNDNTRGGSSPACVASAITATTAIMISAVIIISVSNGSY